MYVLRREQVCLFASCKCRPCTPFSLFWQLDRSQQHITEMRMKHHIGREKGELVCCLLPNCFRKGKIHYALCVDR